jgi:hypothetical protein
MPWKPAEQFAQATVQDDQRVVAIFNENERSWHGHTVIAVSGPLGESQSWTQTYDFLPGEKHAWGQPESVEYAPLDETAPKQWKAVEGKAGGRGYPDVALSSRPGVGYRQIAPNEASSGRRKSRNLEAITTFPVHKQVPGFVRFRAEEGHQDGPVLFGKFERNHTWVVSSALGDRLQTSINESADRPPPYAAAFDIEKLLDAKALEAHNCQSWVKARMTDAGLDLRWQDRGPLPSSRQNEWLCSACGLLILGTAAYLLSKSSTQ